MMELNHLSYITLWVTHFDECVIFYRRLLGLPVEHIEENFAQFVPSGCKLYLHRMEDAPPLRLHTVELHFEVEDVDVAYRSLLKRGAVFESAPENMPWGTRMAAFKDPEGFPIEIVGPLV
jgi:catechol 2,3-dioxygenase-like lactoylglutathione lyase family enzyme